MYQPDKSLPNVLEIRADANDHWTLLAAFADEFAAFVYARQYAKSRPHYQYQIVVYKWQALPLPFIGDAPIATRYTIKAIEHAS